MQQLLSMEFLQLLLTGFFTLVASSGFWLFITKKSEKNDLKTELLMGLAHDRIVFLGMSYIDRGWITQDEYESLHEYLFKPYDKMGGNGSAKRVMIEVDRLPIRMSKHEQNTEPNKGNGTK
jgi:hypothetical protein